MTNEQAIKELKKLKYLTNGIVGEALRMAIEALQTEVVRCKDCRYRELDGEVTHFFWCITNERPVDDDDFCAWGERKGGDDK